MRIRYLALLTLPLVSAAGAAPGLPQYDLVIANGRVMDPETQYDKIANVGVKDGRIVAITAEPLSGKRTIDAKGLVVAPGFIDTHYHATDPFGTKLAVADGVTTGMDLESGTSSVGKWYEQRQQTGWQNNYGTTASLLFARFKVHDPEVAVTGPLSYFDAERYALEAAKDGVPGWSVSRSNVEQMNRILRDLDEDMRQGALGVGDPAAYMARGSTSYEQFEVQKAAARYGRLISVHTRYHMDPSTPTEAPIALDEVLANAMVLRAPLLLCHDNDYGWWENEEKLQMARAQGFNVWGEYYPYDAGATIISAEFLRPELWEKKFGYKYEETLYDPGTGKFMTKDEYLDIVKKNPGYRIMAFNPQRKSWIKYWLTMPGMTVASDSSKGTGKDGKLLPYDADITEYAGHPRTSSTFAKTLELARANGVPLMFTLTQLTYLSAKHLGDTGLKAMQERGRMQVGKVADITLFNPKTVAARATYKLGESGLQPIGIPYVIVNGTIVVDNGKVLPVKAGQPIRFPVEEAGRFQAVDPHGWLKENTINVPDMHQGEDDGSAIFR